jgi:hypothetical protein
VAISWRSSTICPISDSKLVRVDNSGELLAIFQSPRRFTEEIGVLRNEHAAKDGRPLQQLIVV